MAINTYAEVGQFITSVLTANAQINGVGNAPHLDFWNTMSYHDFTTGNVPGGVLEKGHPVPILVIGDSANSNLIHSLQGTGIFSPTGDQDQMPANGPPWFTPAQIKEIADWIDAGCPP